MNAYSDILALPRPISRRHPQMRRADRAKQFMPFAALTGYEEIMGEKETLYEPFRELSEEQRDRLDQKLYRLHDLLTAGRRPAITVEYFVPAPTQPDPHACLGPYRTLSGVARKMDLENGTLRLDGQAVPMDDITGLWFSQGVTKGQKE